MLTRRSSLMVLVATGKMAGHRSALAQPTPRAALQAPFNVRRIREHFAKQQVAAACEPVEPSMTGLDGVSFYNDRNGSDTDVSRLRADVAAAAPLDRWLRVIQTANQDWLRAGNGAAAGCALHHLDAWAQADALMGNFNQQGDFRRKWTLGGAAVAYLSLREYEEANVQAKRNIIAWLTRVAQSIMPRYERSAGPGFISASQNNHAYWAGLAVGAVAIAADNLSMFNWAMARLDIGLQQIGPDGSMPLELRRGRLALGYHLVAFAPLAVLERMGVSNGRPLSPQGKAAMDRLQGFCIAGLQDPDRVARMVQAAQGRPESNRPPDFREAAGIEVRLGLFPDHGISNLMAPVRPVRHRWLGGDVTLLWNIDALPQR